MSRVPAFLNVFRLWSRLRSNYWFVPTLIIGFGFGLSYIMLTIDAALPPGYFIDEGWVYTRDPAGARELLSVVAQSMITVAGVVFSVTVVALALASNQFGTRVLKSFARDVGNQIALGTLLGTFLYGILIMRRVESQRNVFVPSLSIAIAIVLAIFSLLVLIYFIHHVIVEIQAENVVASVVDDLYETMDVLFPKRQDKDDRQEREQLSPTESCMITRTNKDICCDKEGFVQRLNIPKLVNLASKCDAVVRLVVKPGDFVSEGMVIARFWSENPCDGKWLQELKDAISIGAQRSYEEDIGIGMQQLSLIAVRSLSPAINAVGTALDAIEHLISSIIRLDGRQIPSPYHRDRDSRLRLVEKDYDFGGMLDSVFDPIRHAGATNPTVIARMVSGLGNALVHIHKPHLKRLLALHLERFATATSQFPQEADRRRVCELYDSLRGRAAA